MERFIDISHILLNQPLSDKKTVFAFAAARAKNLGICIDESDLAADLAAREAEIPTGLQDGFAIPHTKSPHVLKPAVLFIRTTDSIPWETLDDSDVNCIFVLLVPEADAGSTHLRLMSKLATCLLDKEFKAYLTNADSAEALSSFIEERIS